MEPGRVESLLRDLCIVLGMYLPVKQRRALAEDPPREVEALVDAVMRAAGLDTADPKWSHVRRRGFEVSLPHFLRFWRSTRR